MAKINMKFPKGALLYTFIAGEGKKNIDRETLEEKFTYTASILLHKDSEEFKELVDTLTGHWETLKKEAGLKGIFKRKQLHFAQEYRTAMIKIHWEDDPKGTIDPETEKVLKVDNGLRMISVATRTKWDNGDKVVVTKKGVTAKSVAEMKAGERVHPFIDITAEFDKAGKGVGEGSEGIISLTLGTNEGSGNPFLTGYLKDVQFTKFVPYTGATTEAVAVDDYEVVELEEPNTEVEGEEANATPEPKPEEQPNM